MSWHYLQGLAEEFSGGISLDGEPCAPLKSNPSVGRCSSDARWMDAYRVSLSGMTCERLTVDHGEDASMSSPGGSRARTSVVPVKGQGSTASDPISGGRWLELSARYDRDTSLWKTHRCLFVEVLPWSSVILPRWGMMLDGVVYRRRMSERPIDGIGCGYWPTPCARDWKGYTKREGESVCNRLRELYGGNGVPNPTWVEWLMAWPIGWTDLEPLEMDKYREWRRQHGGF